MLPIHRFVLRNEAIVTAISACVLMYFQLAHGNLIPLESPFHHTRY